MNVTKDCGDVWAPSYLSLLSTIVGAVFCLIITVGNLMIIVAVVVDPLKKLRYPFNYFVVNLAVADLIVGMISMPFGLYTHSQEYLKKKPAFRSVVKSFHMSLFISLTASLISLIALSIDRYIAIKFATKYRRYLTWKKGWITSCIIWTLSLSIPLIYLEVGYIDFLMIYINTAVVIAAVTLIITYTRVYKFLQAQTEKLKKNTAIAKHETKVLEVKRAYWQQRVTRIFLWILILFLCCYTPGTIIVYILQFCTKCDCEFIHIMRDISFYLITVNSCMNPFVFAFKSKHYKFALRELWERIRAILTQNKPTTAKGNVRERTHGIEQRTLDTWSETSNTATH